MGWDPFSPFKVGGGSDQWFGREGAIRGVTGAGGAAAAADDGRRWRRRRRELLLLFLRPAVLDGERRRRGSPFGQALLYRSLKNNWEFIGRRGRGKRLVIRGLSSWNWMQDYSSISIAQKSLIEEIPTLLCPTFLTEFSHQSQKAACLMYISAGAYRRLYMSSGGLLSVRIAALVFFKSNYDFDVLNSLWKRMSCPGRPDCLV
ncbi:uncharacterized protein LOC122046673 isoform X3 [Zingiber officinale]|uniref:uncharacterized protein LOC122046673 isoform X3 n=1 Tax=Zingiber officinale TaxID=94328 RepID=UPI001C4CEAAE|nr:uncharacterized protein LOC122046673 isoform X3 [Zingiber officinale]